MKERFISTFLIIAILSLNSSFAGAGLYEDPSAVLRAAGHGEINWTDMTIRASGSSVPDADTPKTAVARLQTERAAKLDAIRNIIKTTRQIQVDTDTTVNDYITASAYVHSRMEIATRRARIIEKRYLPEEEVEVVVEIPITGLLIEAIVAQSAPLTVPVNGKQSYTGLLIDARGMAVSPAMAPKILDTGGTEIYGPSYVSREALVSRGIAAYAKNATDNMSIERAGENPLVIMGISASGVSRSDIVISRADVLLLRDSSQNLGFLEQCRVIILVD